MPARYAVPIDDIRFALAAARPEGLPVEDALLQQILVQAGRFAGERLVPLNLPGDREGARLERGRVITPTGFAAVYEDWIAGGWMGVGAPERWGGAGLPALVTAPLDEIWNGANMSFYVCPTLTQAAVKLLVAHGTPEQQERYLPDLISGRWTASMGLTEPQAGSDLSLVSTEAIDAGDGSYRLRGAKVFTSFGDHDWSENIVGLVLARTRGAPAGSRGISLFIVPKFLPDGQRNDVVCTAVEHKLGLRASPTCAMSYGGKDGATGYLLGAENSGLAAMFVMMNKARIACALQAVGQSERALQQARDYARERRQGRDDSGAAAHIGEHPDVRMMLLRMSALTLAARTLAYAAVAAAEENGGTSPRGGLLTPIAKAMTSAWACEVADLNIQVHGGLGYIEESGVSQFLRDARAIPIYEGTNGIQAIDLVERKVVADGGAALLAEIDALASIIARARSVDNIGNGPHRLDAACAMLREALLWLLQPGRTRDERLAAASPFIRLAGTVLAGGYLLRGFVTTEAEGNAGQRAAFRWYATVALAACPALLEEAVSAPALVGATAN